jgi:hypothetical protein
LNKQEYVTNETDEYGRDIEFILHPQLAPGEVAQTQILIGAASLTTFGGTLQVSLPRIKYEYNEYDDNLPGIVRYAIVKIVYEDNGETKEAYGYHLINEVDSNDEQTLDLSLALNEALRNVETEEGSCRISLVFASWPPTNKNGNPVPEGEYNNGSMEVITYINGGAAASDSNTVDPEYNDVRGQMNLTLLFPGTSEHTVYLPVITKR